MVRVVERKVFLVERDTDSSFKKYWLRVTGRFETCFDCHKESRICHMKLRNFMPQNHVSTTNFVCRHLLLRTEGWGSPTTGSIYSFSYCFFRRDKILIYLLRQLLRTHEKHLSHFKWMKNAYDSVPEGNLDLRE